MKVKEAERLIKMVLARMGRKYCTEQAVELVTVTGLVESGYKYLYQIKGPARSFWQIEPETAVDNIKNYLRYRPSLAIIFGRISGLGSEVWMDPNIELWDWILTTNLAAAIIHCRIKYWRIPKPVPKTTEGMANYWKKYYNSSEGAGTERKWIEAVERYMV